MSGVGGIGGGAAGIRDILAMRQQILDRSDLLQQVRDSAGPAKAEPARTGGGFGEALNSALEGVNATQKRAEALTTAYETGEVTDIAQVMLARQESGIAFEATLQVRNRLLNAYQDIMRLGV